MKKIFSIFVVLFLFITIQNSFSQASRFRLDNGLLLYTEDAYTSGADASEFELGLINLSIYDTKFSNFSKGELKDGWSGSLESKFGLGFFIAKDNKFVPSFFPFEGTLKYNFNDETESVPAISLLAGVNYILQGRSDANDRSGGIVKLIGTKRFGKVGMNLNVNYIVGFEKCSNQFHKDNFQLGYSANYMLQDDLMVMGEVFNMNKDLYLVNIGTRKILPNSMILSAGLGTSIGTKRQYDVQLMFAITWLNGL